MAADGAAPPRSAGGGAALLLRAAGWAALPGHVDVDGHTDGDKRTGKGKGKGKGNGSYMDQLRDLPHDDTCPCCAKRQKRIRRLEKEQERITDVLAANREQATPAKGDGGLPGTADRALPGPMEVDPLEALRLQEEFGRLEEAKRELEAEGEKRKETIERNRGEMFTQRLRGKL
eukprot:gene41688-40983_t